MTELELKNDLLRKYLAPTLEASNLTLEEWLKANDIDAIEAIAKWQADDELLFSEATTNKLMGLLLELRKAQLEEELNKNRKERF